MDEATTLEISDSAARAARIALALRELLARMDRTDLADLAEAIHVEASQSGVRLLGAPGDPVTLGVIGSAQRACQVALTLHDLLEALGRHDLGRLAWVIYLEASTSAETMGGVLGIDVDVA